MKDNYIISGSVTQYQVKCNEIPFFINNNGDIAYREPYRVILYVYGKTQKYSEEICRSLNNAYKLGYEIDRVIWK